MAITDNVQPNSGGYDEEWRKLLTLGSNANNTNASTSNKNYGPYTPTSLASLKNFTLPSSYNSNFSRSMNQGATIDPDLFNIRTGNATQDYDSSQDKGGLFGKGWITNENLMGFKNLSAGIGSAVGALTDWKNLKLAQNNYAKAWELSDKNLENQRITTNNLIRKDNNWQRVMNNSEALSKYV